MFRDHSFAQKVAKLNDSELDDEEGTNEPSLPSADGNDEQG
ncbi:MAG: hypothetical protein ACI8T1_000307 [Verrucomicrobiales bacterium]|jgi:hypothetical protein